MKIKKCQLRTDSGFTLVELMVTIAIIAILAAVGYASFTNASKNTRISKRLQDLRAIKNALINFKTDTGAYPVVTISNQCANQVLTVLTTKYMPAIPTDPSNTCYFYVSDSAGTNYKLYTDPNLINGDMSVPVLNSQPSFVDPLGSQNPTDWAVYSPNGSSLK